MNNQMKLLHYAMAGIKAELVEFQRLLLLQEKFGLDAILYPDIQKLGNTEQAKRFANLRDKYEVALQYGEALQQLIDNVNNKAFQDALKDFLNSK